jgi:hypothetical protein
MSQFKPNEEEQSPYATLTVVQAEVSVSQGTFKKYLAFLEIEPVCFHIGTLTLYISCHELERVRYLKHYPSQHARIMLPALSPVTVVQEADMYA